jgi:hypothetical protein
MRHHHTIERALGLELLNTEYIFILSLLYMRNWHVMVATLGPRCMEQQQLPLPEVRQSTKSAPSGWFRVDNRNINALPAEYLG